MARELDQSPKKIESKVHAQTHTIMNTYGIEDSNESPMIYKEAL